MENNNSNYNNNMQLRDDKIDLASFHVSFVLLGHGRKGFCNTKQRKKKDFTDKPFKGLIYAFVTPQTFY